MVFPSSGHTGPKKIRPSELKFCHGVISNTLRDGTPLDKIFEDVLYGRLDVHDLLPLETMYDPFRGNLCVTNGNRRLVVLQKLESYGVISEITVDVRKFDAEIFKRENVSLCKGDHVKIRGDIDVIENIEEIWEKRSDRLGEFPSDKFLGKSQINK